MTIDGVHNTALSLRTAVGYIQYLLNSSGRQVRGAAGSVLVELSQRNVHLRIKD